MYKILIVIGLISQPKPHKLVELRPIFQVIELAMGKDYKIWDDTCFARAIYLRFGPYTE